MAVSHGGFKMIERISGKENPAMTQLVKQEMEKIATNQGPGQMFGNKSGLVIEPVVNPAGINPAEKNPTQIG